MPTDSEWAWPGGRVRLVKVCAARSLCAFAGREMGQKGSRYQSVVKAIESNHPKITQVNFDRGAIGERAAEKIASALKTNK